MLVKLYTDGSTLYNPGPGGWAYYGLVEGGSDLRGSGSLPRTTNNRMELTAAIKGLLAAAAMKPRPRVLVYSDSQYVIKGITMWVAGWIKKGWRTREGNDVLNRDLWEQLDSTTNLLHVDWQWVRGHNGNVYNGLVDRLAREAASGIARS